jgi:purine-binding chemotaxis protein CheW
MENQIVIFELDEEYYGVDISIVESIIKMQSITNIPHAPSFVEGVINLRGKILPVIDLRKRFSLSPKEDNQDNRIVVITLGDSEAGMIVDNVSEVLTIQDTDIEPAPNMVSMVDSNFITGIAKLGERLVIMLDLKAVLSVQDRRSAPKALPAAV